MEEVAVPAGHEARVGLIDDFVDSAVAVADDPPARLSAALGHVVQIVAYRVSSGVGVERGATRLEIDIDPRLPSERPDRADRRLGLPVVPALQQARQPRLALTRVPLAITRTSLLSGAAARELDRAAIVLLGSPVRSPRCWPD